jgi:hypothetical protein
MVPAVAVKVAVVAPLRTVTDPGTVSAAALLARAIDAPPAVAAFESVTTQVAVRPELRLVGVQTRELKAGGADAR